VLSFSVAAQAGSWQQNVSIGGFSNVHIYTPDSNFSIGRGKALMLVLHGCVQPINNYLSANLETAAEQYGMVIAVPDAKFKAGFSCWSYWQGSISRSSGDYANQVYIAGLSSGATFANTAACLAPDVFAGLGVSAGPSIGTSSGGALGPCEAANVQQRCSQYAGAYGDFLATQVASIAQGDNDTSVNQCYNAQNADGMAALYGVSKIPGTTTISDGLGRTAEQTLWQQGRVSMLWLNGVGHAWSGGSGASGGYVSSQSINYAAYLGQYFQQNNLRVDRNSAPVVDSLTLAVNGEYIAITGHAGDSDGSVASIVVTISDSANNSHSFDTAVDVDGDFSALSSSLSDGLYIVGVVAIDNQGALGESVNGAVRIGPEPDPVAPSLSNIEVSVNAQCASVSGDVVDENQNLQSVVVAYPNGTETAVVNGIEFLAERCNLPGGSHRVTVTATDTGNLSSSQTVEFIIDSGEVATLDAHISAGRLDYTNYANCYLEYGGSAFQLTQVSVNTQCQWRDEDATCVGPLVSCSGGGNPDPGGCEQETQFNYYHKVAGRAYSSGNILSPDYFANGSDESLPGSTWGNTTLHSNDGITWFVGNCP
jgi:poly(3-hydroxybutyrate) depolymerase